MLRTYETAYAAAADAAAVGERCGHADQSRDRRDGPLADMVIRLFLGCLMTGGIVAYRPPLHCVEDAVT
jgi:hypothetical protein